MRPHIAQVQNGNSDATIPTAVAVGLNPSNKTDPILRPRVNVVTETEACPNTSPTTTPLRSDNTSFVTGNSGRNSSSAAEILVPNNNFATGGEGIIPSYLSASQISSMRNESRQPQSQAQYLKQYVSNFKASSSTTTGESVNEAVLPIATTVDRTAHTHFMPPLPSRPKLPNQFQSSNIVYGAMPEAPTNTPVVLPAAPQNTIIAQQRSSSSSRQPEMVGMSSLYVNREVATRTVAKSSNVEGEEEESKTEAASESVKISCASKNYLDVTLVSLSTSSSTSVVENGTLVTAPMRGSSVGRPPPIWDVPNNTSNGSSPSQQYYNGMHHLSVASSSSVTAPSVYASAFPAPSPAEASCINDEISDPVQALQDTIQWAIDQRCQLKGDGMELHGNGSGGGLSIQSGGSFVVDPVCARAAKLEIELAMSNLFHHSDKLNVDLVNRSSETGTCQVQVLRSVGPWSLGIPTENSIMQCWVNTINNANHLIYIENQFFISGLGGSEILNPIAEALLDRIVRAYHNHEQLRVIVLIPHHPNGDVAFKERPRIIFHFESMTINK